MLARHAHAQQQIDRQRRLAVVAAGLRAPASAPRIIERARSQVALWRARGLCSADYIGAWERLLAEPAKAADLLEDPSPAAARLRQNHPFAGSL